ncbi:MAG TPA: alpha-amylase [Candidatus Competibacter sp.]|nr:alpha-amylase [Candidatus Competibacter sp.]HRX62892.1 alpha-amylase [Candidatus Competibacter sp.]
MSDELNGTMMQYFHWYSPDDGSFWDEVVERAAELAQAGFTGVWLPPAYKGIDGDRDVGYGVYDLYDLGEFEQKGSVRTKYGTRQQYLRAIAALRAAGLQIYADTVLNHRIGGDAAETARAVPFLQDDRVHPRGESREVEVYTRFTFPGRKGQYSPFEWRWQHFDAVDYDAKTRESGMVYLFDGKQFDDHVSLERGNFAYLMGCDLDFQNEEVRAELLRWGKWYLDTTGVDGFRLDAIKHIAAWFFPNWLDEMTEHAGRELFAVGEYWSPDVNALHLYLNRLGPHMSLFDVALHYNFHFASRMGGNYDMRRILDNTLMQQRPYQAVTFVENHDSQPLQALESVVEPWFKPLAYAMILLRREGYPCVFHADYYGAEYEDRGRDGQLYRIVMPSHRTLIDKFLYARRHYAHGSQYDYFDHWNRIGWTRIGNAEFPKAMAVLLSDGPGGGKWMEVHKSNAKFVDLTGHVKEPVYTNEAGWGEFRCLDGSVSVWIEE